jgi:hypothetical protein
VCGLDIYYRLPPSDSLRFACVHRVGESSSINYGDSTFAQNLAEVGGPYCAFSSVDKNIGCALVPITAADLMNVPPPQEEQQPVQSQPSTPEQQQTPDQQSGPQQQQAPAQSPPSSNARGEDPGGYYASSYRTASLIYCASNPGWRRLSPSYLQHFDTLEQAQAAYPNRPLSC